jgi:4,5-dihydroxyphthalate decarboxylase
VTRLFPDPRSTERTYFAKTGIFPIMHAVAIRNTLVEQHPWIVEAVFNAYSKAKAQSFQEMFRTGWIFDSLPWYGQELEETRALMGDNFYSYGIGPNRTTLETLFRYSHRQGLASRELSVEELFHPTSLELEESFA